MSFFFFFFKLCWVLVAVRWLSLIAESGVFSSDGGWASHCEGFSCCGAQALGTWASVVAACRLSILWLAGSRACGLW